MALPGSGAISASMIRTELNIPSQVPFSIASASLVHYSDLNALSISSSNDTLNITDPNAMGEWKNYNHAFTRSLEPFSNLRVPYGYPYSTFAQVNVGTNNAVIPFTASGFSISGTAPRSEVSYSLYYTTYSLNIKQSGKLIQKGILNATTPSSSFTYNYNASSGSIVTFLFRQTDGGWTVKSGLNYCRINLAGMGTQNAALAVAGYGWQTPLAPGNYTYLAKTEAFNGSTWSTSNDINFARSALAGAGTQNSAVIMGGYSPSLGITVGTEKYNGTTWNGGTGMNVARCALAGAGTQNAAIAVAGETDGVDSCVGSRCTETYDGTSWTAAGALISAYNKEKLAGVGTTNATLTIGGEGTYKPNIFTSCFVIWGTTEEYNGSSWSFGGSLINFRSCLAAAGTQNSALAFGGDNYFRNPTCYDNNISERYNGISWSSDARPNICRYSLAGAGDSSAALSFGGSAGSSYLTCTESYLL